IGVSRRSRGHRDQTQASVARGEIAGRLFQGGTPMNDLSGRREFVKRVAACGLAVASFDTADGVAAEARELPRARDHTLVTIAGTPRERGRLYGKQFKESICSFLDKEILQKFTTPSMSRDDLLRYAGQCARAIRDYSPLITDELEGI